jgi:hypothetical protein
MNTLPNTDFLLDIDQEYLIKYNLARLGFTNSVDVKEQTSNLDFNKNIYKINNFGFRDEKDLIPGNPAEILAFGCSQTYGVGLPQNYIWPVLLEKEIQKTVANLGMSGAGAKTIFEVMMYYIKYIGKPKMVIAMFPDCFRYLHVRDKDFYTVTNNNYPMFPESPQLSVTYIRTADYDTGELYMKDKFIKLPCDPGYVIPPQESIKQFFSSVYMMETVCNLLNIKFYWGTYYGYNNTLLFEMLKNKRFQLDISNYIDKIYSISSDWLSKSNKLLDIEPSYQSMIKLAADKQHLGIQWHVYVVEKIMEHLNNDNIRN